ncbi:MAG TPA: hypothetical protein P5110_01740 [Candidatus Omnitrophota bacterium]|nr:hypothetical protein [Candidatus Omnitrophota bacterium]
MKNSAQPSGISRTFTAAPAAIVTAAHKTSSNPITTYLKKSSGEHTVYFSKPVTSSGWFEFKWKEYSGKEHLTYISAYDLWKGPRSIGFTLDAKALAKNEYKNLEGYTVKDPVNLGTVAALDISYIGSDGKTQYYGTLDMNIKDGRHFGVVPIEIVSPGFLNG